LRQGDHSSNRLEGDVTTSTVGISMAKERRKIKSQANTRKRGQRKNSLGNHLIYPQDQSIPEIYGPKRGRNAENSVK
jgi:hypothetical protein